LLCNNIELIRQKHIFYWDENGGNEAYLERILPLKISSLEFEHRKNYQLQFIKVYNFFQFCESDSEYSGYLKEFLKRKDLSDYNSYLLSIIDPYLVMITNSETSSILGVDHDNKYAINFFNAFLINDQCVEANEDYLQLREFPLYLGKDGHYTFLFNNFFIDKLYQGFLFDFAKVLKEAGIVSMSYPKLKTDLGNRFSEKILFYKVMEQCFNTYGKKQWNGSELKIFLNKGEPDYYLRSGDKIFLFEFKDYTIGTEIKHAKSGTAVIEKILTRLSGSLVQLTNCIKTIMDGTYQTLGIDNFNSSQVMIFPILVFTDLSLEADGVNYILKRKLNDLIKEKGLIKYRIKDLTIINLDSLMAFQDLFRNGHINLAACIKSYFDYIAKGGHRNQMYPFDEYFKHYLVTKKHNLLKTPEYFDNMILQLRDYQEN